MDNENRLDTTMRERVNPAISELESEGSLLSKLELGKVDCKIDQNEERHFSHCSLSLTTQDNVVYEMQIQVELYGEIQSIKEIRQQLLVSLPHAYINSLS